MWEMIDSLRSVVDGLGPAFTAPTAATCSSLLLAWVMCSGKKNLRRVGEIDRPQSLPDHTQRHDLDTFYNFFERSAWAPADLAYRVGLLILTRLSLTGCVCLLVDDTLAHKTGRCVWGLGWFRDAVASTRKRVATASGHNWVVVAIAVCNPLTGNAVLALPLVARLHRSGGGRPSCAALAKEMLAFVLEKFPGRRFTLVADGAYATKDLLRDLDGRVSFVGRLRGDAALYDPRVPRAKKGKRGPKAKKGPRLPSPKEAAKKADRKRKMVGQWLWQEVKVVVYGKERVLKAVSYVALWPHVLGLRAALVVVVRDPSGAMEDIYLFTSDTEAKVEWVITQFAWRWAIEVLFRASKQEMEIEGPQHYCQASVEKVAPWVWSMQSVLMLWYLTAGKELPEAKELEARMDPWDSKFSLRHMIRVLRYATLNATFSPNSHSDTEFQRSTQALINCLVMAA
jgi:DDE superfamily endonuclease